MESYTPRRIERHGTRTFGPWRIKVYSVQFGARPVDWAGFAPGMDAALRELPEPDEARGCPGLAFLIAHQGRTGDYTVIAWWDRENELPLRVFVRRSGETWRPARGDESICVWDLEVLWAERQAWVETMLTPGGGGADAYMARALPGAA